MNLACDTSVLVPALASWHPGHAESRRFVLRDVKAIPAPVLLEAYSVLTRLPAPHRLESSIVAETVSALPHDICSLPAGEYRALVSRLTKAGIRGGGIYDALIAATAMHNDMTLVTRDRRARNVYDVVGVRYSLI